MIHGYLSLEKALELNSLHFGRKVGDFGKIKALAPAETPQNGTESRTFFRDDTRRPLGDLTLAGMQRGSLGTPRHPMRIFGQYALVMLLEGQGSFRDALGFHGTVQAGDVLLVFSEIAHTYGPGAGQRWDEIFVCFRGPLFDVWRQQKLLDPARPVLTLGQPALLRSRLQTLLESDRPSNLSQHLEQIRHFCSLLEMLTLEPLRPAEPPWLAQSLALLQSDLGQDLISQEVARRVGLSYEDFRKKFGRAMGVSLVRYRAQARLEAAQALLMRGEISQRSIAISLGFRDEAHFSRRFKDLTGVSPRSWKHGQSAVAAGANLENGP